MESADVRQMLGKIVSREIDPHTAAETLLNGLFGAAEIKA